MSNPLNIPDSTHVFTVCSVIGASNIIEKEDKKQLLRIEGTDTYKLIVVSSKYAHFWLDKTFRLVNGEDDWLYCNYVDENHKDMHLTLRFFNRKYDHSERPGDKVWTFTGDRSPGTFANRQTQAPSAILCGPPTALQSSVLPVDPTAPPEWGGQNAN